MQPLNSSVSPKTIENRSRDHRVIKAVLMTSTTNVLDTDGTPIAASQSRVDNVEHIPLTTLPPGDYEVHVERPNISDTAPSGGYALAWHSTVPWWSQSASRFRVSVRRIENTLIIRVINSKSPLPYLPAQQGNRHLHSRSNGGRRDFSVRTTHYVC